MFKVLRSSAGAGKTHALVKSYLLLCLEKENTTAYRQVLALTFTNKAAAEMKERVLRYLEKLHQRELSSPALRDVMDELLVRTGKSETEIAGRAGSVLRHMMHHWSEVAISTIDSFTRRVVKPFARDLQLDHDLRMTTEQDWYRERAVEATVAEAGVNAQVTELLTAACAQLLEDEAPWNPSRPLSELGRELDKEASIAPLAALHGMKTGDVRALSDHLKSECRAFEREVQGIGNSVLRAISEAGLSAEDLASTNKGFHSFFDKLSRLDDKWIAPGANTVKAMESGKLHSSKAGAHAISTLERMETELRARYQQAVDLLASGQRDHFVRRAVLRELNTAFALAELDRHLSTLKEEDGVAFFSDLTRRVADVVRDEPAPFIFERIGERYRHFLLDEFQDTSVMQWRTLLPLIHNALSTGGSALIVGDAKQAIYRWRNGEVRLFSKLPALYPPPTTSMEQEYEQSLHNHFYAPTPLAANFRSSGTIIRFNNALFTELAAVLPDELRKIYDEHDQDVKRELAGLVHIEKGNDDSAADEPETIQSEFLVRCAREAEADGFAPGDIAVLVRTASEGQRAADTLTAAGYAVTSPDGLRLEGHPLAECLLDLLRVLHGSDVAAATRVLQHRARLSARGDSGRLDPFTGTGIVRDPVAAVRSWLKEHGDPVLRSTITDLITRLALVLDSPPDAYLATLLDAANAFAANGGQDLGAFLDHWHRSGRRRSISPPRNARTIQVMTVHKAKGLEFPIVIMPNARMSSQGRSTEWMWVGPGVAVPELEYALVRKSALLRDAGVPEILEEDRMRLLDNLDLLYVAFTRPKQRLYALVPSKGADDVTKALLSYMETHGGEGRLILGERTGPLAPSMNNDGEEIAFVGHEARDLAIRFEASSEWDPTDPDPHQRFGNAVHSLLSNVQKASDLDAAIENAIRDGSLKATDTIPLREKLAGLLTRPELASWFGATTRASTEATIIDAHGRSHRPDRVVFDGDIVRVLDIKTGQASHSHHEQVRRYMHLLRELGHEQVEGALLYIIDGSLVAVAA